MGKPVAYCEAVVSYFDILGFRKLIKESESSPSKLVDLDDILEAAARKGGYSVGLSQNVEAALLLKKYNFSDLVVRRSFRSNALGLVEHLHFEFLTLARIQWELIHFYRVLIRGGVCLKGMSDGRFLFGPALVRSYELAEKIAVVPRIVIDSQLVKLAGKVDAQWWKDVVRRGEDGQYFIDYLNVLLRNNNNLDDSVQLLTLHRNFILAALADVSNYGDEKIRQKTIWVALYHNSTIERFLKDHAERTNGLAPLQIEDQHIDT
jgi:hypothetical protein